MTSTPPGDEPRDRSPTDASLYALEKLAQAVDELATGTGNLSDRLYEAAYYILRIQPDEIPDELRHVLMGVKDDLQFAQPKWDEGRPVDTLKITDDEDAKAIAHRILELYRELGTACCVEFARARPAPVARNLCRSRTWSRNQAVKRRALCAATWLDFCNPPIGQRMSKDGMPLLIRELHGKGFCAFTDV